MLSDLLTPATTPPAQTAVAAPVPPTAPPPAPAPAVAPPPTAAPDTSTQVIPPEYQGTIDWSRARNPRSTAAILDALRRLEDLGFTAEEAAVMGMGQFPVRGQADWEDDWHDPRFGPPFHLHQGTDIFAERGTPVIAPEAGTVRFEDGGLGGRAAYVTAADGTYYYLAHLNAYADDIYSGAAVNQGQLLLENARLEGVSDRVEVKDGDARRLPFADGTFDVVVTKEVLHNIYNAAERDTAVREIARVLKPGGRLLIGDVRHTGRYAQVLRQSGLEDVRRSPASVPSLLIAAMTLGFAYPANVRARKPAAAA